MKGYDHADANDYDASDRWTLTPKPYKKSPYGDVVWYRSCPDIILESQFT